MVQQIYRYAASDGSEHNTRAEAEEYELRLAELEEVMSQMPRVEDPTGNFVNGGGYKDWPIATVARVRSDIMRMLRKWNPYLFQDSVNDPGWGYIGRSLSDSDIRPGMYGHFMRLFFNTDEAGSEYGQQYYRNHPSECGKVSYK